MKAELTAIQDAYDDLQVKAREQANREEELRHRAKDAVASRDSERAARVKAEREMRDYADKLLDAQDEIKALRRELGEVERNLTREVEEQMRVWIFYFILADPLLWQYSNSPYKRRSRR